MVKQTSHHSNGAMHNKYILCTNDATVFCKLLALLQQSVKPMVPAVKNKILVAWGLDEYNFSRAHTTGATSQGPVVWRPISA